MSVANITFRQADAHDAVFLSDVFKSTRVDELQGVGWTPAQTSQFLQQQFEFQTLDWRRTCPDALWRIILVNGEPAGRLVTHRRAAARDFRVMDIALLPAFRNGGVGTRILGDVIASAHAEGWRVSIHVEINNPARRLYARLGFVPVEERGVYLLMECPPGPAPAAPLPAATATLAAQPF